MKAFKRVIPSLSMATSIAFLLTSSAHAADDTISYSGHLDLYYQYDFNRSSALNDLVGRAFDVRNNSFSLAVAQLNVVKAPSKKDPYGFTANLVFGRTADINVAGRQPNETAYKNFQQLYGTFAGKDGLTVDFGKFATWIGYESLVTPDNPNYSLSGEFNYGQPFWHMGLRVLKPFGDKFTGGLYLVNGWNEVEDTNASKTIGVTASYAVSPKTTFAVNYIGGNEGSSVANGSGLSGLGVSSVQMVDTVLVHNVNDKLKLAFNADYASAVGSDAAAPTGIWYAYSGYATYSLGSDSIAVRAETLKDPDGLRFFGIGGGGSLSSLTATFNKSVTKNSMLRFEVRRDFASADVFPSDKGLSSNRTTFTVAHSIRF